MRVVNTPRQTLFSCESERNQEIIANSKKDDTVSESFKELIYLTFVMKCATKSNNKSHVNRQTNIFFLERHLKKLFTTPSAIKSLKNSFVMDRQTNGPTD